MKSIMKFLIVAIVLVGCNPQKNNEIKIFNKLTYKLTTKERVLPITKLTINSFQSLIGNSGVQIPLFKHIKGEDYNTYIAIPVHTNDTIICPKNLGISDSIKNENIIEKEGRIYKTGKKNDTIVFQYIFDYQGSVIYILTETKSQDIAQQLFNVQSFDDRINIKLTE